MTTIALRFPAGRYHATPWGRHVNEGAVEWPPSPWRIARALLAVGFNKRGWTGVPEEAMRLLPRLCAHPPSYRLPKGTVAHTRHYMPIRSGRGETTTKVLDAFIRLDTGHPLLIRYPVELDSAERALLADLVAGFGYFGRAESWVDGDLVADVEPDSDWCRPHVAGLGGPPGLGGDQVALLAPVAPEDYDRWREAAVARALAVREADKGRPATKGDHVAIDRVHPRDLVSCLLADTGELQKQGWSQPPGSTRVLYDRPPGLLERRPPRPPMRRPPTPPVQAALLALASDRPTGQVLPLYTRALPQAELIHQSLISILGDEAPRCAVLSGRDPGTGGPLEGSHQHAHYLPLDLDEDGRLDHMIIHARMGLGALARRAIGQLRRTWTKGEDQDIIVTLAGFGTLDQFKAQLRRRSGHPIAELGESRKWVGVTPFVPPRHLKKRRHTLEDQVRAELRNRGFHQPVTIERIARHELVARRLLRFVRTRRHGKPQPPADRAFGLRLIFDEPIRGPIALGYASHYGLGLFTAEDTDP